MDLESIVNWTKILTFVAATVGAIIGIGVLLSQTRISLTLMSHGERERHKVFWTIAVFFCFVIVCYALGFMTNIFRVSAQQFKSQIFNESQVTESDEASVSNNEVVSESVAEQNEQQNTEQDDYSTIVNIVFVVLILVALIASIVYTAGIRKKEKYRTQYYKVRKWYRYFEIGFFLFLAILFLEINLVAGLVMTLDNYYIFGVIISCLHSILCTGAVVSSSNRYNEEIAQLKSFYDGKVVYLFETEGNNFVAGDNMYVSDCDEFYIIPITELDEPLVDAQSEDDVYLKKANVDIDNKLKHSKNQVLRCVAADCKKKSIDLNSECNLKIEFVDKKIKYTATIGDNEHSNTVENKPVNHEEWNGNVLLL